MLTSARMSRRLFLPQSTLDGWLAEGRADLSPAGLLLRDEGVEVALQGACHFLGLLEGRDEAGLVSKVKSEGDLKALGAELCGDSVILGDCAYEVAQGFLVIPPGSRGREDPERGAALQTGGRGLPG